MAPPTVPGVPAHASRPARPRPASHRTSPLIVTPAVGAYCSRGRPSATSPPWMRKVSPRMPASATTTLDPPPRTVTGTPLALRQANDGHGVVADCHRDQQVGGPPTRIVVSRASGASRSMVRRRRRGPQRLDEGARRSRTARLMRTSLARASCSSSARTASAWLTSSKRTSSAGASWAACPRSAVMTMATTG